VTQPSEDWEHFKQEIGLTAELEASAPNHVEVPATNWHQNFYIARSSIAGDGTFTARPFPSGSLVGPAWIQGKRTELGCKVNHSPTPTARMVKLTGDVWLMTSTDTAANQELTTNYRDTVRLFRSEPK
jgi:hypothetical protein